MRPFRKSATTHCMVLSCQEIHGLRFYQPSQFGISEYVRLLKRRLAATWLSRFTRVRCFAVFVYNRNFFCEISFYYNCDGNDASLKMGGRMWSSNGANDVCSSSNFVSASLWDKPASKKATNIIRLVISAPIDLDGRPSYFTRSGDSFKK